MAKGTKTTKDAHGEAKYPYTTKPSSLRKFLQQIPNKPKPPKVVSSTLKTWGFKDANDSSILRVLKQIGLLADSGEPTVSYASFMKKDVGPASLGSLVKARYKDLFDHIADPSRASSDDLTNFFNIHSGGSEATIQYQVQTFKALVENSRFDETAVSGGSTPGKTGTQATGKHEASDQSSPTFHIDLHIHLPENKSRADYENIFSSIAEHILGKRQ